MNKPAPLPSVLSHPSKVNLRSGIMRLSELRGITTFWAGRIGTSKLNEVQCLHHLEQVFKQPERVKAILEKMPSPQQQILQVVQRYGGTVHGLLLESKLVSRGLVERPAPRNFISPRKPKEDPVYLLCAKGVLLSPTGEITQVSPYCYYSSAYDRRYPTLCLPGPVVGLLQPAPPLSWKPSRPASDMTPAGARSLTEVSLDLLTLAQALAQQGSWDVLSGGSMTRNLQKKMAKLLPANEADPFQPPDRETLYYELLRGLGAITIGEVGTIDLERLERHLQAPAPEQAWHLLRAWLRTELWQDGIGPVRNRDSSADYVRRRPSDLVEAREMVVWALSRVAQGANDFLDLEPFLIDFWNATGEDSGLASFYWSFAWQPDFPLSHGKEKIPAGPRRLLAYWLSDTGTWVANVLLSTLAHLGLVERGQSSKGSEVRHGFRLTPLGKAVFGAPEQTVELPSTEARCLVVQPNHDVLLYLDDAEASVIGTLTRLAQRETQSGERVQTFTLTRDSVYQALESGLDLETIQRFLLQHSRTGLPENVAQSLAEWARRRETLAIRVDTTLLAAPAGQPSPLALPPGAQALGSQFALLARGGTRAVKTDLVCNHQTESPITWQVDETGLVRVTAETNAVSLARLSQFADQVANGWQISAASVRRARERGITTEQILAWCNEHVRESIPPLLETSIRNWTRRGEVFLGRLLLLQVHDAQACAAIGSSQRFGPLLLAHLPPNWFVVNEEKEEELRRLLEELGFAAGVDWKLTQSPAEAEASAKGKRKGKKR